MDRIVHSGRSARAPPAEEAVMKKVLALGVAALAACSSGKKEKPIAYGVAGDPTPTELTAIADAETTLAGSVTFVAPTDPGTGGPGLADQLVAALGGYAATARAPDATAAKLAGTTVRNAFDTGGMDPACVTTEQANGVTTVRWGQLTPCTVTTSDPTTTMTVDVAGWLAWNGATGVTTWDLGESFSMSSTSGDPLAMSGTAALHGSMTVTADRIAIDAASDADVKTAMQGMRVDETVHTTLGGTVGYQASAPDLCVVSGSLLLEQRANAMGIEQAQGWRFDWSGCGAFTVAHGS
jgi:hypothetical protein